MDPKDTEFQMRQLRLDVSGAAEYDPGKALQQIFDLLKTKDDTQRFVALSLLKTLLDGNRPLQRDISILTQCWKAIPPTFLTRLFKAQARASTDTEAKSMFELAVAIVHAFIVLLQNHLSVILPKDMGPGQLKYWKDRVEAEMAGVTSSSEEIRVLIFQTFLSFAHTVEGANILIEIEDWAPLLNHFPRDILVIDMFRTTYITLGKANEQVSIDKVCQSFDRNFATLISVCAKEPIEQLEEFFKYITNSIVAKVPLKVYQPTSTWLEPLVKLIVTKAVTPRKGPALPKLRAEAIKLASILCRLHHIKTTEILFNPNIRQENAPDTKPLSYLFIKLILVDIRSTIPSLLEQINSPSYKETSERLACSYDILSSFTNYLVRASEDDSNLNLPLFTPDLLLQLRTDISQTISLTIEYLRDRYDASIGGAPGLHPSARAPPLAITWDTTTGLPNDLFTTSQIRAVAVWIREDDGEDLRKEAAGITDVLLSLYNLENTSNPYTGEDSTQEIEVALEGICSTSEGIHAFISENGHDKLVSKLSSLEATGTDGTRGLAIILLLLNVSNSGEVGPTKEAYLQSILTLAANVNENFQDQEMERRDEFIAGIFDLVYDSLGRAPRGLIEKYKGLAEKVLEKVRKIAKRNGPQQEQFEGTVEALEDLIQNGGNGHGIHFI